MLNLSDAVADMPTLFTYEEVDGGDFLKLSTPFLYPDGDFIDIYLVKTPAGTYLTDLGETTAYLNTYEILSLPAVHDMAIAQVLLVQGVELFQGEIRVIWDGRAWTVIRLIQAIIQIGSLGDGA